MTATATTTTRKKLETATLVSMPREIGKPVTLARV
jgi:hypothetical protein